VTTHLTGLGNEVVGEVAVYDPVDGVEAEDLASNEGTLELIDKVVIPVESGVLAKSSLVRRLSSVELASLDHHPHCTEGVSDDRSLRRADDVDLAAENENEKTDEEDAETQEVSRPEVDITLHVWGGKQGERSSVDAPVEDHVNPLNGNGRVNDDALASLVVLSNDHLSSLVLVGNQRRNVGLDTSSSQTNNDDGNDETTEASAMIESSRERGKGKDEQTDDVDAAEDDDGVVLAEILIGDDGNENGSNVAPELEEGRKSSGSLVAHAERTATVFTTAGTRDVVLEDTRGAVIGETLAEFDNGDEESTLGERLTDLAEGSHLLGGRPDATNTIILYDYGDRVRAGSSGAVFLLKGDVGAGDIVVIDCGTV